MKTSRYIILSLAAVAIAASCKEELNPDKPINANPGDEVVFGAALPGKTKTVYGDENTETKTFPIYWVKGDKVKVASPQCMSGRNVAEYAVSVNTATQNYADSLTRTGEYGVQWGSAEKADFYSIYPSTSGTALNINGETVTATLHVDATQFASTSTKKNGTSDYLYSQPAEMGNVVMYAKATASKTDPAVKLHYTPFSTVIEFELTAPNKSDTQHKTEIIIQSITLVAPQGKTIAGDFTFNFPNTEDESKENDNPSATAYGEGDNTITLHFLDNKHQYTTKLSTLVRTLKAKMCVMPIGGVENLNDWKVEVATSAGTFSKKLTAQTGELKPGLVHKIKLPELNYAKSEWEFIPGNWIPSLPDYENIYLSEISLPGAWYAGSTESYQATDNITTLWNAGVRAFAVETRITTGSYVAGTTPEGVVLSGSQGNSLRSYSAGTNSLGTGSTSKAKVGYGGTSIATIITNVANQVKNSNEYGVLVLSYADGGESGHRPVDYGAWLQLLYDAYNGLTPDVKKYIYQDQVTANTTVKDVLGKLILKINVDENIAMKGSVSSRNFAYANNLPALFSYNPFLIQMKGADYTRPYYSNLSWSNWGDGTDYYRTYDLVDNLKSIAANKFIWVFSSANRTKNDKGSLSYPTYTQRQTALKAMMDYSKQIYDASTHNVWFYFNCGGTLVTTDFWGNEDDPSPTEFAKTMNLWLKNTINAKTDPSPLGIVMFNQCTGANATYYGEDIIKAIIEMNSKFYLKHAGTSGGSTGGSASGNEVPNDATLTNGGNAI